MNRTDFLKKLGLGLGAAVIVPKVLEAEPLPENEEVKLAIDVQTISHFSFNGRDACPAEVLQIWREHKILVYDSYYGNAPIVIKGKVEVVDVAEYK